MRKIQKRSNCPVSYCLDFIGDKWVLIIIRDILFHKKHSYKSFLESTEGMATNVLGDRLKMLTEKGFINSEVDPSKKSMKIYSITQKGKDLLPIILEMMVWSSKHGSFGDDSDRLNKFAKRIEDDRNEILELMYNGLP